MALFKRTKIEILDTQINLLSKICDDCRIDKDSLTWKECHFKKELLQKLRRDIFE